MACAKRKRSTAVKKEGRLFSVGCEMEDIVRVEHIIKIEGSLPFGRTGRDENEPRESSKFEHLGCRFEKVSGS